MAMRESLSLSFYLPRSHRTFAADMLRSLETYATAAGPALGMCFNDDGNAEALDDARWAHVRSKMLAARGALVQLADVSPYEERFWFEYHGKNDTTRFLPDQISVMRCWFPTEYLEEHGPSHLRALALEMLGSLPVHSGSLALSLNPLNVSAGLKPSLGELALRYPGLSLDNISSVVLHLGTRVKDISWLTFLGQPALGEVGGVAGLRARLRSPDTTIEELPSDRVVITLGEWPDAGDIQEGRTLPAYRELARALEPVLYREQDEYWQDPYSSPEEMRRVERRFLD